MTTGSADRAGRATALNRLGANPVLLFLISATSLYLGATLAVNAFDEVNPAGVAWLRLVGASIVLLAIRRPWRRSWTRRRLIDAGVFGVTLAAMNTLFYLSINEIPLGTSVAIEFIGPVTVGVIGTRSLRNGIALGLGASGVVLLAGIEVGGSPLGVLYALGAAFCWGLYIVLGKRVAANGDGIDGLAVGTAIGMVVLAPLLVVPASAAFSSVGLLLQCLLVGVLSNAVPYGLDQVVLKRVTSAQFALLLSILPAVAAIFGAIVLGQIPTTFELVGIGLVIGAIAVREREVDDLEVATGAD